MEPFVGRVACACRGLPDHRSPRRVVLTGGPGGGKTAFLELVRQSFCRHVAVLPEAASIVFGGGFPREERPDALRAAQRAIFRVQHELEALAGGWDVAVILCDRGTVDGAAYWPGTDSLWADVGTTLDKELARYEAVIHLRTPAGGAGYDHRNPLRIETAQQALALDARIADAWSRHPRRAIVEAERGFLAKAERALELLRREVPDCCRSHLLAQPVPDTHA